MSHSEPWYQSRRFRQVAVALFALIVIAEGIVAIGFRENDFAWHLELGRNFLAGDPLKRGEWYPVFRPMLNAIPASLPDPYGRALCYLLAIPALIGSLLLWNRIATVRRPVASSVAFAAGAFTLALLYPYVIRDLDDCGLQIYLLLFLAIGGWCVVNGRSFFAGLSLAVAASYKTTPVLFLPLLIWKREWKPAAWMAAWIVALNLSPALFIGWDATMAANAKWYGLTRKSSAIVDPSLNAVEPPRPQNQSLTVAIARYVQTYAPDHGMYVNHPAFVQFGALAPKEAKRAVSVGLLAFAAILAWRFRRKWTSNETGGELAPEWATTGILCAILSPMCWLQHLVLVVPCVFLEFRELLTANSNGERYPRYRMVLLGVIGFIVLVLQRDIVQRDLSILVLSYKFDTLAALIAIFLVLTQPRRMRITSTATLEAPICAAA